ncbi:hypothetical protein ABKV19_001222 [Rosa sericea]
MAGDEEKAVVQKPLDQQTSKNAAPWENSNHPLFLHHSDQPGAMLVAQALVEDNYTTWEQSMLMALTIKNKKGFVDGTLAKPTHNPSEQLQWERCNTLVKTWLLGAMSKDISNSVIHCKDARSICDAAPEVKSFIEAQKTMKFLMGLNEGFAQIRSNIISLDPLPTLNKAYAMVLRQEKQVEATAGKSGSMTKASAFAVKRPEKFEKQEKSAQSFSRDSQFMGGENKYCEKCNMTNHYTRNCRAHLKCTYCDGNGHTYNYCRRRKRMMGEGSSNSKANHVGTMSEGKEDAVNFPLSKTECNQMLGLLNRIQAAGNKVKDGNQLLEMLNTNKPSTTNFVGNVPNRP